MLHLERTSRNCFQSIYFVASALQSPTTLLYQQIKTWTLTLRIINVLPSTPDFSYPTTLKPPPWWSSRKLRGNYVISKKKKARIETAPASATNTTTTTTTT
jgi:hypothetical protein